MPESGEFEPELQIIEETLDYHFRNAKEQLSSWYLGQYAVDFCDGLAMADSNVGGTIIPTIDYDRQKRSLVIRKDNEAMMELADELESYEINTDETLRTLVGTGVARALLGWYAFKSREVQLTQEQRDDLLAIYHEKDSILSQVEMFDLENETYTGKTVERMKEEDLEYTNALRAATGLSLVHVACISDLPSRWTNAMKLLLYDEEVARYKDIRVLKPVMASWEQTFSVLDENFNKPYFAMAFPMSIAEIVKIPIISKPEDSGEE